MTVYDWGYTQLGKGIRELGHLYVNLHDGDLRKVIRMYKVGDPSCVNYANCRDIINDKVLKEYREQYISNIKIRGASNEKIIKLIENENTLFEKVEKAVNDYFQREFKNFDESKAIIAAHDLYETAASVLRNTDVEAVIGSGNVQALINALINFFNANDETSKLSTNDKIALAKAMLGKEKGSLKTAMADKKITPVTQSMLNRIKSGLYQIDSAYATKDTKESLQAAVNSTTGFAGEAIIRSAVMARNNAATLIKKYATEVNALGTKRTKVKAGYSAVQTTTTMKADLGIKQLSDFKYKAPLCYGYFDAGVVVHSGKDKFTIEYDLGFTEKVHEIYKQKADRTGKLSLGSANVTLGDVIEDIYNMTAGAVDRADFFEGVVLSYTTKKENTGSADLGVNISKNLRDLVERRVLAYCLAGTNLTDEKTAFLIVNGQEIYSVYQILKAVLNQNFSSDNFSKRFFRVVNHGRYKAAEKARTPSTIVGPWPNPIDALCRNRETVEFVKAMKLTGILDLNQVEDAIKKSVI